MVVTCVIDFDDNPFCTYYAGQVMSGKVTLQSDKVKQLKGIVLKIRGFAHTSWSERKSSTTTNANGSSSRTSTTYYSGHEDYIGSLTYLLGDIENQLSILEPGIHTFTFSCHLPTTCPSSFEGQYGHIRYTVQVNLLRPWKFDQKFTKGFTVLKVMDLNYDSPILKMPSQSEVQKTFCCGPCKTQPLNIHVELPQAGYVPGQTIPVRVLVTNDSNVRVEEMKVELVLLVCYYSQKPYTNTRNERIVVTKLKGDSVPVHCKKLFQYPLIVPATPPTCFNLCRILQLAYQVEVEAKVKRWHTNHVICLPVTIGNVPLLDVIQQQPKLQHAMVYEPTEQTDATTTILTENGALFKKEAENPAGDASTSATAALGYAATTPFANNANIPPPSFEAAVHMKLGKIKEDEAHDYGESEFAPRYPVFNVPSPTAPGMDETDHSGGHVNGAVQLNNGTWL